MTVRAPHFALGYFRLGLSKALRVTHIEHLVAKMVEMKRVRVRPVPTVYAAGRDLECQNMARKFAGAFLDGAFVAMQQAAPQPAPAPLSEREAFEVAWEKLHGKRPVLWSRLFAEHKMETPAHSEGNYFAATEQAAWKLWQARAALAAHGGQ